jgi:hypothetical protein
MWYPLLAQHLLLIPALFQILLKRPSMQAIKHLENYLTMSPGTKSTTWDGVKSCFVQYYQGNCTMQDLTLYCLHAVTSGDSGWVHAYTLYNLGFSIISSMFFINHLNSWNRFNCLNLLNSLTAQAAGADQAVGTVNP